MEVEGGSNVVPGGQEIRHSVYSALCVQSLYKVPDDKRLKSHRVTAEKIAHIP